MSWLNDTVDYVKENTGAVVGGAAYSGFWTAVLYDNWPTAEVAGMALANFFIVATGFRKPEKFTEPIGLVKILNEEEDIEPDLSMDLI